MDNQPVRAGRLHEAPAHPATLKGPPYKPLADECAKHVLAVTSCWPLCPFNQPTDQHYMVLWTEGFSATACLPCSSQPVH